MYPYDVSYKADLREGDHKNGSSSSTRVIAHRGTLDVLADGQNPITDRKTPTSFHFKKSSIRPLRIKGTRRVYGRNYDNLMNDYWISGPLDISKYGNTNVAGFADQSDFTQPYNDALNRLYGSIRSGSQLNLAVDAAEARQTKRMVRQATDAAGEVVRFARKARKRALVKTGRAAVKGISSTWLAYRYGWTPLLSTIHGLAEFSLSQYGTRSVRARSTLSEKGTSDAVVYDYYGSKAKGFTMESSLRVEHKVYYTVGDAAALDRARLTSMDPTVIAWELLPYSFVVDWFWDMGSYLQNLEAANTAGLEFHSGYTTYTSLRKLRGKGRAENYKSSWHWYHYSTLEWDGEADWKTLQRVPIYDFPKPRLPTATVDLGSRQIKDAAALLAANLL